MLHKTSVNGGTCRQQQTFYYFYSFLSFLFSGAESSVAKLIVIKKGTTEEIQMDIARVLALTSGGGAPYARTSFGNTCKDVLSYLSSPSDPVIHPCPFPSVLDSFFVTRTLFSFPPCRCSSEMIDGAVNQCIRMHLCIMCGIDATHVRAHIRAHATHICRHR
jgi:hypothetical protein